MTSHELERQLLEKEDLPVVVSDEGDLNVITEAITTPDRKAIRLFRL